VEDNVFTLVLLPLALGCIMVTLGFSLTLADFRRVLTAPRGVLIGLVNLFFVAPLLAFAVAELFGLAPAFAVGLVLLGASPGGTMANLMTHLAKGETALSITMTAISSVAAVVTVPIFLTLAINHFGADLDSDPEMLGVALRQNDPRDTEQCRQWEQWNSSHGGRWRVSVGRLHGHARVIPRHLHGR